MAGEVAKNFRDKVDEALCSLGERLGNRTVTCVLLLLTGIVYFSSLTGVWHPTNDSALYLSLARSLVRGEGYTYLGEPHSLAMPGLPLLLACAMKIGLGEMWQLNLLMTLMGLGLCWSTWFLARLVANRAVANLSVFFVGLSEATLGWSHHILTEVPFALLSVLALMCVVLTWRHHRIRLGWGCAAAGLGAAATLFRMNGAVLFPAFFVWLWLTVPRTASLWKRCLLAAVFCAAGLVPSCFWLVRAQRHWTPYSSSYISYAASARGSRAYGRRSSYLVNLAKTPKELATPAASHSVRRIWGSTGRGALQVVWLALLLIGSVMLALRRELLLPVLIAGQCLFTALHHPSSRYLFSVFPALVVVSMIAGVHLSKRAGFRGRLLAAMLFCVFAAQSAISAYCGSRWETMPEVRNLETITTKLEIMREYYILKDRLRALPARTQSYARYGRILTWLADRPVRRLRLPEKESGSDFPAFYCHFGGFDLLIFDLRKRQDRKYLAAAELMRKQGLYRLRRLRMSGTGHLVVYEVENALGARAVPGSAGAVRPGSPASGPSRAKQGEANRFNQRLTPGGRPPSASRKPIRSGS